MKVERQTKKADKPSTFEMTLTAVGTAKEIAWLEEQIDKLCSGREEGCK